MGAGSDPAHTTAMDEFFNHQAASAYLASIEDPILQSLVRSSYQTICLADFRPERSFDLLYFAKIMREFMKDREGLARSLRGDFGENLTG
jgi:hypothetical protein